MHFTMLRGIYRWRRFLSNQELCRRMTNESHESNLHARISMYICSQSGYTTSSKLQVSFSCLVGRIEFCKATYWYSFSHWSRCSLSCCALVVFAFSSMKPLKDDTRAQHCFTPGEFECVKANLLDISRNVQNASG